MDNFNAFITILLHHRGQVLLELSSRFTNDIVDAVSSSNPNIKFMLEDVDEHIFEQGSYDSERLVSVANRTM